MKRFLLHLSALAVAAHGAAFAAPQLVGGDFESLKLKTGPTTMDEFGNAVCGPGDLDGDGVPDYVVGAHRVSWAGAYCGMVVAYSGADHSELWREYGENSQDRLGYALAKVGDVDGDGFDDVAVSAPYYTYTNAFGTLVDTAGKIYVLSGEDGSEIWSYRSPTRTRRLGAAMGASDVDGDGTLDVLAGMPNAASGSLYYAGKISVFDGGTGTFIEHVYGTTSYAKFGTSVAGIGDINDDGYEDVAVGVPGKDTSGMTDNGRVTVLSGRNLSGHGGGRYLALLDGNRDGGQLGISVAGPGDVDGDGTPDILAGAPYSSFASTSKGGTAELFSGDAFTRLQVWYGKDDDDHFGMVVAAGGDVDHDAVPDLLIGAPDRGTGVFDQDGACYAYSGRTDDLIFEYSGSAFDNGRFGSALASIGDINGDGTEEFICGAPEADNNSTDDGIARVLSVDPFLTISKHTASLGGDYVELQMDFPAAGNTYRVLVSLAGMGPMTRHGVEIPLTPDLWTARTLSGIYPAFASDFVGILDGEGRDTATMNFGSLPAGLAGLNVHFAAIRESGGSTTHSSIVQILQFVP